MCSWMYRNTDMHVNMYGEVWVCEDVHRYVGRCMSAYCAIFALFFFLDGCVALWNQGVRVKWLDQDDLLHKDHLILERGPSSSPKQPVNKPMACAGAGANPLPENTVTRDGNANSASSSSSSSSSNQPGKKDSNSAGTGNNGSSNTGTSAPPAAGAEGAASS